MNQELIITAKYRRFQLFNRSDFQSAKNTVKQLADVNEIFINDNAVRGVLKPTRIRVGESLYSYYGYKTDGIFRSQEEINNYKDANGALIQPNAKPGDIKFLKKKEIPVRLITMIL